MNLFKKLFKRKKLTPIQKLKLKSKLNLLFGLEIGTFIGIAIILGTFSDKFPFSTLDYFGNRIAASGYDAVMFSNYDDNITIEIANLCGRFNIPKEQISCMQSQIEFFYNYTNIENHTLNNPDKYYKEGGVCRDIVILQKSILLKMGWNAYYCFPKPKHVTLSAYRQIECGDNNKSFCHTYCDINGLYSKCY